MRELILAEGPDGMTIKGKKAPLVALYTVHVEESHDLDGNVIVKNTIHSAKGNGGDPGLTFDGVADPHSNAQLIIDFVRKRLKGLTDLR